MIGGDYEGPDEEVDAGVATISSIMVVLLLKE